MMRHEDNPRLPPKCPNCRRRYRRVADWWDRYNNQVAMRDGVCFDCAALRRKTLEKLNNFEPYYRVSPWHPMGNRRANRGWRRGYDPGRYQREYADRSGNVHRVTFIGFSE